MSNRITTAQITSVSPNIGKNLLSAGVFRVLIGCEESQTVSKSFRDLGIEAYSCDLKECSGGLPEYHLQMDIFKAIDLMDWDFIGLHPVCTKMTLSGNRHYAPGKEKHFERLEAVEWTIKLWEYACKKAKYVYMENPMGAMNGDKRLPKPQIVQPYFFGDKFQKTTCLWLQNLSPLYHNKEPNLFDSNVTHVGKGEMWVAKSGKVMPKWFAESASTNNEANRTLRSKTFPGIAKAMSVQWGSYACQCNVVRCSFSGCQNKTSGRSYKTQRIRALRRQGFKVQKFNNIQKLNRCTKVQYIFVRPAYAKPLLCDAFSV